MVLVLALHCLLCGICKVYMDILCRWSCDGRYFARMTLDTLSVYETPVSTLISFLFFGVDEVCSRFKTDSVYAGMT